MGCRRRGKKCNKTIMKMCWLLGYDVDTAIRDDAGKWHLFKLTLDTGEILWFDFRVHILAFLDEKAEKANITV